MYTGASYSPKTECHFEKRSKIYVKLRPQRAKDQKSKVELFLNSKGHLAYFLPKFHCELNPIERVWGQSKRYTKAYSKYTLQSLRINIPRGLDSVTVDNIRNYFRKAREYMFAYLEGVPVGSDLERRVKMYKKSITSHRRVSALQ